MRYLIYGNISNDKDGTPYLVEESFDEPYFEELSEKGVVLDTYTMVSQIGRIILLEVPTIKEAQEIMAQIPSALEGVIRYDILTPD